MTETKPMHETMMQYFEWYLPDDHTLWDRLAHEAPRLAQAGFTMVWMPPAYKGQAGDADVGYGVYDMYDLGQFDAKGSVETKYGSKRAYLHAIDALHGSGLKAIADIVFNHRMGADENETVRAHIVDPDDRTRSDAAAFEADVETGYTFPARHGEYSDFTWDWHDFTGTDFTANSGETGIMRFDGKRWNDHVSKERGNFDYIMGADVDFTEPEVVNELFAWGSWYTRLTGVDGFRLDAIKSIDARFFDAWLRAMRAQGRHPGFAVGEYWSGDADELEGYLRDCGHCMTLFDVPLHHRLHDISEHPESHDLRHAFDGSLVAREPEYACVFADNHDTQPGQALQSWVLPWFKPHAYAMLLLRDMRHPCVFYGDYHGIAHDGVRPVAALPSMVWIRRNLLADGVVDYPCDDPRSLCWAVPGAHPVLVLMSTAGAAFRRVEDYSLRGLTFVDVCDGSNTVTMDDAGVGVLHCAERSCAVFVTVRDAERMRRSLS